MKILKGIAFLILSLVVAILIIALFVNKKYEVVKAITINRPNKVVFEYIKQLKNQDNYSVWAQKDPNMKKTYRGMDGTVGFVSAWDSELKEVGKGEQEIKGITKGKRLDFELRFTKPFEATDYASMSTDSVGPNLTKVKWGFNGKMNYPMNILLLCMNMEDMLGNDLEKGLSNLKTVLEKQ